MTPLEAAEVRRRFLLLSATRWLPTGVLLPALFVLMQQRGLGLATIGVVFAASSAVVAALELPTGGLADSLGRRPVLLAAGALSLAAMLVLAWADSLAWFFVAATLEGIYRALDSGPLESWYVDASQAADPGVEIERGLAAQSVAVAAALTAGSLLTAALVYLPAPAGLPALGLPVLVAAALRILDLAATWRLLLESPPAAPRAHGALALTLTGARATADTIRHALTLIRPGSALFALVLVELFWGAGLTGVEMLAGPRTVEAVGDPRAGVASYAAATAVAWLISGAGGAAAPWIARQCGSWVWAAIAFRVAQAGGVALAVLIAGPVGILLAYLAFYLVHGAANVAHAGLVHRHAPSATRTTVVSLNSLTSRLGGVLAAPALGAMAGGQGLVFALGASAVLLVVPAPLYLAARAPAGTAAPAARASS